MYTTEHFIADLERPWTSVQAGFEQIDRGKATEYRATDGRKLAADIKTRGRAATQSAGQNRGAMSHALSGRDADQGQLAVLTGPGIATANRNVRSRRDSLYRRSMCLGCLPSLGAESDQRIHTHRAACRNVRREHGHGDKRDKDHDKGYGIQRTQAEKQSR
jgi:hypothetical protein